MRYQEIFSEAIENKPFLLHLWLKNRIRELDSFILEGKAACELIRNNEREGRSLLENVIQHGRPEGSERLPSLYGYSGKLDGYFHLESIRQCLNAWHELLITPDISDRQYRSDEWLRATIKWKDHVEPLPPEYLAAIDSVKYAEKGLAEWGFEPGNPENNNDEEYPHTIKLIEAWTAIARIIPRIENTLKTIFSKLDAMLHRKSFYDFSKYRPKHESVEPLYHTTAFATEIMSDGFQDEPPESWRGLGSFGRQKEISFTHDYVVAHTIYRMMRDMCLIAHGLLTANRIFEWMQTEGINTKNAMAYSYWGSGTMTEIEKTAYLYNYWLSMTKTRSAPGLTYPNKLVLMMKDRKLSDIGILKCECKLDGTEEYLEAESEFRLTPDRVQSVKRVL